MAVKEQSAVGVHVVRPEAARPRFRPAVFAPAARGGGRRPRSGPGARRLPAACALPGRLRRRWRAAPWRPAHPSRARRGRGPLARAIGTGVRLAVPDPAGDARMGCGPGAAAERPGYGGAPRRGRRRPPPPPRRAPPLPPSGNADRSGGEDEAAGAGASSGGSAGAATFPEGAPGDTGLPPAGPGARPPTPAEPDADTAPPPPERSSTLPPNAHPAILGSMRLQRAGDLNGSWEIQDVASSPRDPAFSKLRLTYRIVLRQDGERVSGDGEKWAENGRRIPAAQRTPIHLSGEVIGREVRVRFTESGNRRDSAGNFRWRLSADGTRVAGTFASSAAAARGVSAAVRLP